jgi:hypothetical protein
MGKRKYDEAGPLLVAGYQGLNERESSIRDRTKVLTECLQYLVQFYDVTSQPEKAAEWRTKLAMVQATRTKPVWPKFSDEQTAASVEP